jgi:hypothetical protein
VDSPDKQEPELLAELDKLIPAFSEEEANTLRQFLSSYIVRRYFAAQFNYAVNDFMQNESETPEQEQKLLARYKKLKGVQYVFTFLLNNFRPEAKP